MKSLDSKTPNQDWHPNIWPPFTQINNSKPQIEVTHGQDALDHELLLFAVCCY